MKYYRGNADTYERVRAAIDADQEWPDAGTLTAIEPAATAPRDASGRVLLAAQQWLVAVAADRLSELEEIAEADYLPAEKPIP